MNLELQQYLADLLKYNNELRDLKQIYQDTDDKVVTQLYKIWSTEQEISSYTPVEIKQALKSLKNK